MRIVNARNPQRTESGSISLSVLFDELSPRWIQFNAVENDSEAHGRELYERASSGEFGTVKPFEYDIEALKDRKRAEVKSAFEQASVDAHCMTSLGFEVNADSVAKRNIDGLIERMEFKGIETEMFRGYDNEFHQVTLDQLKEMRIDVIDNANALYQRKWLLERQVEECTTVEQLNSININFEV